MFELLKTQVQKWRNKGTHGSGDRDLKVGNFRPLAILSYEVVQVSETLEIKSTKFRPCVIVQFALGPPSVDGGIDFLSSLLFFFVVYVFVVVLRFVFKASQRHVFRDGDLGPHFGQGKGEAHFW